MIATRVVRPEAHGRAVGVITSLGPLGAVSGPVLSGLIVDGLGWPWIFYLNLPVCLAVILIARAGLSPDGPLAAPGRALLAEAAVLGAALVAGMLALSLAAGSHPAWLLLALAAVPPLIVWARMAGSRGTRALVRTPGGGRAARHRAADLDGGRRRRLHGLVPPAAGGGAQPLGGRHDPARLPRRHGPGRAGRGA